MVLGLIIGIAAALFKSGKDADKNFPQTKVGGSQEPCPKGDDLKKKHFVQEKDYSCVIASCRNMIYWLTGKNIPESQLRDEMRDIMNKPDHDFNKNGINPAYVPQLLKKHGVETETKKNVSNQDLETLTSGGKPVLIGFKNPGHRVMLDSVTENQDGSKTYNVRDPAPSYKGQTRRMTEEQFNAKYNKNAIVVVPK